MRCRAGVCFGLRSDGESFFDAFAFHKHPLFLVGFEHEVGCGGEHPWECREFLGDETGDFPQIGTLDDDQEVESTGHQGAGADLAVAGDSLGQFVESSFAFRGDLDLNDGPHLIESEFFLIQNGTVAEDDLFVLIGANSGLHCGFVGLKHRGDLGTVQRGVRGQEFEQWIHGAKTSLAPVASHTFFAILAVKAPAGPIPGSV